MKALNQKTFAPLHDASSADPRKQPIVVQQWMIDAEINRQRTPEGRKILIDDLRYARDQGWVLGNWTLPEV